MGKLGDAVGRLIGAPLRMLLPKNRLLRFLVIAIPILLVLALFAPILELLGKGIDALVKIFTPLLDNPTGRLVLTNLMLVALAWILFRMLAGRVQRIRSGLVLSNHQEAVQAVLAGRDRRARELFSAVSKYSGPLPGEYRHVRSDARLKLARLVLEQGDATGAMGWLAPVKEHDLPKELRRSLLQLRTEVYLQQGEVLPETLEQELRAALKQFPEDARLLALLRRMHRERGDLETAAELQEKVYKHASPARKLNERETLVRDLVDAGEQALSNDAPDAALSFSKRARKVDGDHPDPMCLRGKVHQARGEARKAIQAWGRSRSPQGLELIGALLDQNPGCVDSRELLECCPTQGGLLLVARELARAGEHRKAMRAARRAAKDAELSPTVAVILAEVMALCGQQEEAEQLGQEAVLRLLAPEAKA
ncbi:MAG: tetratricopeptide repeat protein [Planctomycetota bacterium]|jgi:tetratricopeptide (TPR) repeat protein